MLSEGIKWRLLGIAEFCFAEDNLRIALLEAIAVLDAASTYEQRQKGIRAMEQVYLALEGRLSNNNWEDLEQLKTWYLQSNYFSHPTAVIDPGARIGADTKIWHYTHIMRDSVIGVSCNIGQNVLVSPNVKLGRGVKVQNNVSLYTGVHCADYVFIGPSVVFTNVINPRSFIERKEAYKTTYLAEGVSIGANATLLCGTHIGAYAMIGAGALITKDVSPHAIMKGVPAQQDGWISKAGYSLKKIAANSFICAESGEQYLLAEDGMLKELS